MNSRTGNRVPVGAEVGADAADAVRFFLPGPTTWRQTTFAMATTTFGASAVGAAATVWWLKRHVARR